MMLTKEAEKFLEQFDFALGALHAEQRQDLVRELRSHFEDRPHTHIAETFGSPEAYAASFVTEQRLSAALARPWPWRIFGALLGTVRDATLFFAVLFIGSFELTGLAFIVCGALKPIYPQDIGTFFTDDGKFIAIGSIAPAAGTHEVLGYWAVPLFIAVGALVFYVSHRILVGIVRWRLRLLREHRVQTKMRNDHALQLG